MLEAHIFYNHSRELALISPFELDPSIFFDRVEYIGRKYAPSEEAVAFLRNSFPKHNGGPWLKASYGQVQQLVDEEKVLFFYDSEGKKRTSAVVSGQRRPLSDARHQVEGDAATLEWVDGGRAHFWRRGDGQWVRGTSR